MLAIERRNEILDILRKNHSVYVSELSRQYDVTEETIRRDLEKLEKEGHVKKTYGGAVYKPNLNLDIPFEIREKFNKEEKTIIGKRIAELVDDGDSLFMDSSSTVLAVARALKQKKRLTILTNSVEILLEYANLKNFNVISTGGTLRERSLSLVGPITIKTLNGFNADKAIISCKGADIEKGVTDSNDLEAEIKKTMIERSSKTILAADSSKLNNISFIKIADLNQFDYLVTDKRLDERWRSFLKNNSMTEYLGR